MTEFKLIEFLENEVTVPRNDGTRGSGLYSVPYKLNGIPDSIWAQLLRKHWQYPSRCTTMHRSDILQVNGNRVILAGTTLDEVEKYHLETLKLAIASANADYAKILHMQKEEADRSAAFVEQHRRNVKDVKHRLQP